MGDFIVDLNLEATLGRQDNKCIRCNGKLGEKVYFRMDQNESLYEAYCVACGTKQAEKDKKNGKEVE